MDLLTSTFIECVGVGVVREETCSVNGEILGHNEIKLACIYSGW